MTSATIRLWELGDELAGIVDELTENGGELTPELEARLTASEGAFETKVESCLLFVRNLQAQADVAKQEVARLAQLARGRERAAERLKDYVLFEMVRIDRGLVETPLIKARIQENGRPSIQWFGPPELIPEMYRRLTITLDGGAAYEAWKRDGMLPDGFVVETGVHLRIQ